WNFCRSKALTVTNRSTPSRAIPTLLLRLSFARDRSRGRPSAHVRRGHKQRLRALHPLDSEKECVIRSRASTAAIFQTLLSARRTFPVSHELKRAPRECSDRATCRR